MPPSRRPSQSAQRGLQLLTLRCSVMPQHRILHERHTFPFGRMSNDTQGRPIRVRLCRECLAQRRMIMAIHLSHVPAKAAPLLAKRLQPQGTLGARETLYLVVVNDHSQPAEPMVPREEDRLPVRAFIALAVAHKHEDAMRASRQPRRICHPATNTKAVTERPRGKLDTWNALVRDMATEHRAIAIVVPQTLHTKESAFGERRVDAGARMAFAQYESVPPGPRWVRRVDAQDPGIEHSNDVCHRKDRPDM